MNLTDYPHRRYDPLGGSWVLVSPHRTKRPWQGQTEETETESLPEYDPGCYLCPGNPRAGGKRNPDYRGTFVFDNDFSALLPETPSERMDEAGLMVAESERGICRVICFSPRHDLTLSRMDTGAIEAVLDSWIGQYRELGSLPWIRSVQIFENRGAMMGCSNPHPHCQIWANETVPVLPAREGEMQRDYRARRGSCLLCDYLALERERGERIVFENDAAAVLVPFWAVWPFEVMLIPKRHIGGLDAVSANEQRGIAEAMRRLGVRFDNLFHTDFPYSMGIHQHPVDGEEHPEWHVHFHYYPPLLRSAEVRKFMVGYELLGMPQRDITAESAAARLREQPEIHFRDR